MRHSMAATPSPAMRMRVMTPFAPGASCDRAQVGRTKRAEPEKRRTPSS